MNKIGILSFIDANNYGGILQIYALQTVISEKCNVDVINYHSDFIKSCYKLPKLNKFFSARFLYNAIVRNSITFYYNKGFDDFRRDYIKLSDKEYSNDNFDLIGYDYKKVIVGSDQVWNLNCNGNDINYFLPFSNKGCLKYSYAASLGISKINNEISKIIEDKLIDYKMISVRETTGKDIIEKVINKNVYVNCDPTLLLSKLKWKNLIADRLINEEYLLIYMIIEDKALIKKARVIAKEKNLKIVYINNRLFKKIGISNLSKISPRDWLNLFYYASYIITNSFHGIAFSINFNKQFQCSLLPRNNKSNIRILNILNNYNLSTRLEDNSYKKEINYEKINLLIEDIRLKSIGYIDKIIETKNSILKKEEK